MAQFASIPSQPTISMPVYRRIEEDLRTRIRVGQWPADTQIPGRRELAKYYNVEVTTIQHAISQLLEDGILRAEAGRGTFVVFGHDDVIPNPLPHLRIGISLRDQGGLEHPDSYIGLTVQGIRDALAPFGLGVSVTFVQDQDLEVIPQMHRSDMAGVLFASPDIDKRTLVDFYWRSGVPSVVVGSSWVGIEAPFVDCDNYTGTNALLDRLVAQGHRKIACAVVHINACHLFDRGQAFRQGMARHGLAIQSGHLIERWKPTGDQAMADIQDLIRSANRPTALVATDPCAALYALKIAKELAIRVPEDLSIVTFDDIYPIEASQPPISSAAAPFCEMGRRGMQMLIDMCLQKPISSPANLMPMKITDRASIAPCPAEKQMA